MQNQASFFEAAGVALDSLRSSKLRSFLTLLGIILSTTTLILVMALIHGMDVYIANTASTMGSEGFRVVRIFMVGFNPKKFLEAQRRNPALTPDEYNDIKQKLTLVREVAIANGRNGTVNYNGETADSVGITGTPANGAVMNNNEIAIGRFYTETEDERRKMVAFLGADVKERFFPGLDPVGKIISIDGRPFEVIGVGKPKGSVFGQSQDNYVSIPVETYFKVYGSRSNSIQYNFIATRRDQLEQAQDEVRMLLRARRHLMPQQEDNFGIVSSDTLVSTWDSLTSVLASAAVGIVSVFMVVGGIVIMNIMLAVVTERTREIGVRKSVGARQADILNQFLVESSTLAGIGGLIGVGIAWALSVLVRNFTPVPMAVPASAVLVGVSLSTVVGLFFGIYPARRAAKLDPIVALRAES